MVDRQQESVNLGGKSRLPKLIFWVSILCPLSLFVPCLSLSVDRLLQIQATLLLALAAGTFAAGYAPYGNYRVDYHNAPATVAAYQATPTRVHTISGTPAVTATIGAYPSYATYQAAPAFSRVYTGAHAVVSPVATAVHAVPAGTVAKLAPGYTTVQGAPVVASGYHTAFPVAGVAKLAAYQASPAFATYHARPAYTGVYQSAPIVGSAVNTAVHAVPVLAGLTKGFTYNTAPTYATVAANPAFATYRSAPVVTRQYHAVPAVAYHAAPAVTAVHAAPAITTVRTGAAVSRVTKSDPYHYSDHSTYHPSTTTLAHAPVSTVAHVPAYGYGVGALGYTHGLPVYGHNYGYGLDSYGYTAKLHKK